MTKKTSKKTAKKSKANKPAVEKRSPIASKAEAAKGKATRKALPKSAGHVCFAAYEGDKGQLVAIPEERAQRIKGHWEFFVSSNGKFLCKAATDADIKPLSELKDQLSGLQFDGPVRSGLMLVQSGPWETSQSCRRLGVPIPANTQAALKEREEVDDMAKKKAAKKSGKTTEPKRDVGTTSGVGLAETWAQLLIENEQASKKNKMTDEQLVARMEKEFPAKKGKSTLTRVSMVRGCFNKGTNMFKSAGAAGVSGRPKSNRYGEDGEAYVRPKKERGKGKGKPAAESKSSKKTAKKSTKKKVASGGKKKTTKKRVVRAAAEAA